MSLSERIKKIISPYIRFYDCPDDCSGCEADCNHIVEQILAAIKEEGYICVGKETVDKIMGEEESDGRDAEANRATAM